MLLNCGVGEDSWESLGLWEIQPIHPKGDFPWVFIGGTDVEAETPIFGHLMRRADSFEKILMLRKIEGRRSRGLQRMRWMASLTQWTWVWVNSGSWWWTGRPGVLWFMGLQRVRHNWATELNWTGKFKIMYVACFLFLWDSSHLKALITFEWTSLASDGRKQFRISTFIFQSFHTVKLIIFSLQLMNFNTWIDLCNTTTIGVNSII